MITIGENPWSYIGLLNECIRTLLTVLLGALLAHFELFDAETFVPQIVKFVFRVALPMHILRGIGIAVDFYNPLFEWNYIIAFLTLRVVALVASFGLVLTSSCRHDKSSGIGQVAVLWLMLSWISSVILGVPISEAVFGSERLGLFYGLLAGVSSFIFQLPLQLLFLECHRLEEDHIQSQRRMVQGTVVVPGNGTSHSTKEGVATGRDVERADSQSLSVYLGEESAVPEVDAPPEAQAAGPVVAPPSDMDASRHVGAKVDPGRVPESSRLALWLRLARRRDVWCRIGRGLASNPVIWGIALGFTLSLSTAGPRYLRPTSPDYVPGLGWIYETLAWFGDTVSPLSLFAMGVWMQQRGKRHRLLTLTLTQAAAGMASKLVLVPLLMVGLAKALSLSDNAGRAAVLIASLPISMAAFSLAAHYRIGEGLLSDSIAWGTTLMLPTVLLWNVVLDALGLFPITAPIPA